MTHDREKHLQELLELFITEFATKYRKGSRDHKQKLWELDELQLLYEALDENLDQFAYLATAIMKIEKNRKQ
jgi:hypothetical protein